MDKKTILYFLLGVSVIGFLDAAYLTYEHYAEIIPPCTLHGCETVLTSPYAVISGIPISLFGLLFYIFAFVSALILLKKTLPALVRALFLGTALAFLFSLYLLYLQAFSIHAFCQYCLLSLATSTTLFVLSFLLLKKDGTPPILNS